MKIKKITMSSVLSSQMLTIGLGRVNQGIFILQVGIYKFYFYRGYTKSAPNGTGVKAI